MPKVCAEIGLHQGGIITKPCLINENMTQVSELIQATVSHQRVAAELGHQLEDGVQVQTEEFSWHE